MPIYYADRTREEYEPIRFSYEERDVMLYALGVGFGNDPMDDGRGPIGSRINAEDINYGRCFS